MNDSSSQYRLCNFRMLAGFTFCLAGVGLALLSASAKPPSEVARKAAKSSRDNLAAEQVRRGIYRGLPVTYVVKNGKAIFQGDIILDKVDPIDPQQRQSSFGINSLGITYSQYLWPRVGNQYQIPYIITSGSGNLANLNSAIAQFNSTFANIKFVARTAQTDYVNFNFDANNNSAQCEATLGRAGGEQQVGGSGGSSNPCTITTILHEMGHTVGLWHEQARPDRNTYITVNYGNVVKGSFYNYDQIYDNAQQTTLFDYASIMDTRRFRSPAMAHQLLNPFPPESRSRTLTATLPLTSTASGGFMATLLPPLPSPAIPRDCTSSSMAPQSRRRKFLTGR